MPREKILIVDDDPDILDVLRLTLQEEDYRVIEAKDGEEALTKTKKQSPDLIVLDYKMPKMDGRQLCRKLKDDLLLSHLPIIMLTAKGELEDKVKGLDAGADDYVVKPFEPKELLARIRMALRRTVRDLDANPLTKLPGNVSIINELQRYLQSGGLFAVCYLDLDKFKSFNDKYGFEHGDEVIRETARIIIRAVKEKGNPEDFIGHIGGDDFVLITTPERVDGLCRKIIEDFDKLSPRFYSEDDRRCGYILARNRKGRIQRIGLLSISMGVVTNVKRKITHVAQIGEIGAELKSYAKGLKGSNYVKDKRGKVK